MNPVGVSESFESSGGGGNDDGSTNPMTNNVPTTVVHLTVGKRRRTKQFRHPTMSSILRCLLLIIFAWNAI
jgi:hypothetical protein